MPAIPGLSFFSLDERDRRYRLVREEMRRRGLEALVVVSSSSLFDYYCGDVRYLTQIGGNSTQVCAVLPVEGDPTAVIPESGRIEFWTQVQDWVQDIRSAEYWHWSVPIAARLREVRAERGRVGIVGLGGHMRAPEGVMSAGTHQALREALPSCTFIDASDLVERIRRRKSSEEIRAVEEAARVLAAGVTAMEATARAGVTDRQVWVAVTRAMMEAGGEPGALYFWQAGPAPNRTNPVPTDRPLQPGDTVLNEFDARFLGYTAQAIHPLSVGPPSPDYAEMAALGAQAYEAALAVLRPGHTLREVWEAVSRQGTGTRYRATHPCVHGTGLGEDGPIDLGTAEESTWANVAVEPGMTLMLQPSFGYTDAGGRLRRISVGDSVVVGEDGPRRLTTRAIGLRPV